MKTLLLNISYVDNSDKFWCESTIKNMRVSFNPDKETIHELVKVVCEEQDGMILTYNSKPRGNVHQDIVDENKKIIGNKIVGYIYRGKSEIYDRGMTESKTVNFDVWVDIFEVIPFDIDELNSI